MIYKAKSYKVVRKIFFFFNIHFSYMGYQQLLQIKGKRGKKGKKRKEKRGSEGRKKMLAACKWFAYISFLLLMKTVW